MKELQKESGTVISSLAALEQLVMTTIKDKEGKVRRASYNIVNIGED